MADDPELNRRIAEFLLYQNEIASRVVNAALTKDARAMNAAARELADHNTAHQDLADDIVKYKANAGIVPTGTEPPAEQAKARRTRKPRP
ncbi:hypothetical protein [Actinoplanes sp. HUAS TT8]|uniref:hypothetical protein n=1 Tax=Actinoplanes sp. HUAS TT8 TaxID=3447453 RepID=UPI003F523E96